MKEPPLKERNIHSSENVSIIKHIILIRLKIYFNKFKVKLMMYGFGDEETPNHESVELLESLVINFIHNMVINLHNFV